MWISTKIRGRERITARLLAIKRSLTETERVLIEVALFKLVLVRRKFLVGGPGWQRRSQAYVRDMAARGHILDPNRPLVLTGALRDSFHISDVDDHHVAIGTPIPYAPKMHYGGVTRQGYRIPRRAILFWGNRDRSHTVKKVRDQARFALTGNPG
jgi:phage gpG-like protein